MPRGTTHGFAPIQFSFDVDLGGAYGIRLSPEGGELALTRLVDGNLDIWVKELPNGPLRRLTDDDEAESYPAWSADGEFVTYVKGELSTRNFDVWRKRADGTGDPELLLDGERGFYQVRWSPDEEWMVLRTPQALGGRESDRDILAFRPGVDSAPVPLVASAESGENDPALSPDGRWLAYSSNRSGRYEVYVSPFPDVDSGRWQVSTEGGEFPLWAHSGDEIFFLDAAGGFVSARVSADGFAFVVLQRETLFDTVELFVGGVPGTDWYNVAPDDERFLMMRLAAGPALGEQITNPRFILVQNWFEELELQGER